MILSFSKSSSSLTAGPNSVNKQHTEYFEFCTSKFEMDPSHKFDLLLFWKDHETKWPNLAQLVKYHLSAPASSAPSERVFSISKQVLSDRRNRLSPESAAVCTVLRANRDIVYKKGDFKPPGSAAARTEQASRSGTLVYFKHHLFN
jgi:hypothetical protein